MDIDQMYIKLKSVRKVADALGVPVGEVRRALVKKCGTLVRYRGLCRTYLVLEDKCFASIMELAEALGTTYNNAYYLARRLAEHVPEFRLVYIDRRIWSRKRLPTTYIVKDSDECRQAFVDYINRLIGTDANRWISWGR